MPITASALSSLPRLPPQHVPRPRLHARLLRGEVRLRLVLAPPGSGKTVLLGECARSAPMGHSVLWLSFGGASLTADAFCQHLGEALGLDVSDETTLTTSLRERSQGLWLFLDDYPRQPAAELDACLDRLLSASAPAVGWWLAGRRRPACNLARLCLEGELLELGSSDLALDASELQDLLTEQDRAWPEHARQALFEQTGGCCAGVRLRLLGLPLEEGVPVPAQMAEAGRVLLHDYLQRELLDELPAPLDSILCGLAHLPRFNAALVAYLFEETPDALEQLLARGAGLELQDGAAGWYRLPPVLAAELAPMGPLQAPGMHRRACQWFSQKGDIHAAFEHSLRAEQPDVAASLLQRLTEEQLLLGHNVARVLRLRDTLPEEMLGSTPRLLVLNAWTLLFVGRLGEAERLLGQFERFLPIPGEARQRGLIAQWMGLAGALAHARGRPGARELLEGALQGLPEDAWAQTLICLSALSQHAQAEGRLDEARLLNREALRQAREQGSLILEAYLELDRAYWLEQRGELGRAEALLYRVQEALQELRQDGCAMAGRVLLRRGWLSLRQARDEEARGLLRAGLREARRSLDPSTVYGYIGLALLDAHQGDLDSGFNLLLEAERQMQLQHVPEALYRGPLLLASGALTLRQGRPAQACEMLARVLARYRSEGLSAPASAPDLVFRVEHQLALAELYDGQLDSALERLQGMLPALQQQGRMALVCEVWLALAEVCYLRGETEAARNALREGLELAERFGLQAALTESRERQPQLFGQAPAAHVQPLLSLRELSVLELIARGCSNLEIGERLFISLHTVKTHARRINGKLGVERRTQAVARAKELGLLNA
ncbi:MAG: Serine/threonine-protein kinase PknK [Pseudomonas citronellolis]|nr:MAG: Serine/threonine-protein kinase PknK [Pseudomonas citronellolis]